MEEEGAIKRRLTVFHGAISIVGCMIGSGIFTNPPVIFDALEGPIPVILCWIFGAIVAYLGAMTYAEWTCRLPRSGGDAPFLEYVYTKPYKMMPHLYSFVRCFFINPGYAASSALASSEYFLRGLQVFEEESFTFCAYQFLYCCILVGSITSIFCLSNRLSTKFFSAFTIISISFIIFIAVLGLLLIMGAFKNIDNNVFFDKFKGPLFPENSRKPANISAALLKTLWAYDGWANLASLAGEIVDPSRTIGPSNIIGISLVAIVYIFVNISYMAVLPLSDLKEGGMANKFAATMDIFGTPKIRQSCLSFIISFCTASCTFMTIYSSSRVAQSTGESMGIIFSNFFAKVAKKTETPINSLIFNMIMTLLMCSIVLISSDAFYIIIDIVSYHFWFFCFFTVLGLLIVKYREGTFGRFGGKKKVNGIEINFIFPSFLLLIIIFFLAGCFFSDSGKVSPKILMSAALGLILLGLIPYLFIWKQRCMKST